MRAKLAAALNQVRQLGAAALAVQVCLLWYSFPVVAWLMVLMMMSRRQTAAPA